MKREKLIGEIGISLASDYADDGVITKKQSKKIDAAVKNAAIFLRTPHVVSSEDIENDIKWLKTYKKLIKNTRKHLQRAMKNPFRYVVHNLSEDQFAVEMYQHMCKATKQTIQLMECELEARY